MSTNFLLRGRVSGRLQTERWVSWPEALRAKRRLESVGYAVTVDWLDPDAILRPVTDFTRSPESAQLAVERRAP